LVYLQCVAATSQFVVEKQKLDRGIGSALRDLASSFIKLLTA